MSEKKPAKMSDADLKFFEEMLIEKRRQLVTAQSDSERASSFQGQKNQAGDGSDSDSADSATDYNTLETTFSLAAREGKYLVYLEEALKRIHDGTFGVCKVCKSKSPAELLAYDLNKIHNSQLEPVSKFAFVGETVPVPL